MTAYKRRFIFGLFFSSIAITSSGCSGQGTLLDSQEKKFALEENALGANHRAFHRVLHFPNGNGLRVPGYIVGIEKADQEAVTGPRLDPELVTERKADEITTSAYKRLLTQNKAHLITHVIKYAEVNRQHAIFQGRIRPCSLYSLFNADGGEDPGNSDATWDKAEVARQLFASCGSDQNTKVSAPENNIHKRAEGCRNHQSDYTTPFQMSWAAIDALCKDLTMTIKDDITHIIVIVMGWNTPQDNAVQNYNSIMAHLLDEYEARSATRRVECTAMDDLESACPPDWKPFKPLVVGVSWASDWELSDLLPIPDSLVRLVSFPNKANDAKEIGVTWLKSLLESAILPSRQLSKSRPKVVVIGHSFGARATLTAITQPNALAASESSDTESYSNGDLFIAIQGAFRINEIFREEKRENGLWEKFHSNGLRFILTASKHDSANETAFWTTYAGMIGAYKDVCQSGQLFKITCETMPYDGSHIRSYGFTLCEDKAAAPPASTPTRNARQLINEWKYQQRNPVLYLDATTAINCRAAFTGGGSHSDIYRRETARLLLDLMN